MPVAEKIQNLKDFTIGADPEFQLLDLEGSVPSNVSSLFPNSGNSEWGLDGNGASCELRPKENLCPIKLISTIREILFRTSLERPELLNYQWQAGSFQVGYPLGGHIHFGTKSLINSSDISFFCRVLSEYVGAISILIEEKNQGIARRSRGNYGATAIDSRNQEAYGFEYRVPSSWLVSPYIAAGLLTLSKSVVSELINNPSFREKFTSSSKFRLVDIDFRDMRTERIRKYFSEIWEEITKLNLYQTYKPYIDILYHLVVNKKTWFPQTEDMKEAWGICKIDIVAKPINLDVLWLAYKNCA